MTVRGREGAGATGSKAPRASEVAATTEGTEERRATSATRVPFDALVAVVEGAAGGFEAQSVDVSLQGMRLRTAYVPEVGEKLACRFDGMGTEIVVDGEVLWRREEAKGGEFGVRFVGLDEATAAAVRAMCMTLEDPGDEEAPAPEGAEATRVARGSRVRLHIEGLGSPMKARVRTSAAKELSVGSNLEFLKVGRALELEDIERGGKREATIDDVKVDVDPETNIPQLVVTLRFDKAAAEPAESRRPSEKPKAIKREKELRDEGARAKPAAAKRPAPASEPDAAEAQDDDGEPEVKASAAAAMLSRARGASQAAMTKVGPAIAGAGARAKSAFGGVLDLVRQRQAERASATKASAPRRTTAPAPGGGLTAEGKRLVRGSVAEEEDVVEAPQGTRRAAVMGGALGLLMVVAIFGAVRLAGRGGHTAAATSQSAVSPVAALPTSNDPVAAPGTPTANVPLFGATPLSTTEPAVAAGAPSASASANAATEPAPGAGEDDDPPGDTAGSGSLKEWGTGSVSHPIVLKIKMDGAIERISGAAGAQGFTVTVPGRRSLLPSSADLSKKDKRLASVNVVNTSRGAEVTVQFKDGVPPYVAKVKGDRLEIAIGKEGKVAKKKKKSKH